MEKKQVIQVNNMVKNIIHRATQHKGEDTLITTARLCNPYDDSCSTTIFNLEVTCLSCMRIMKARLEKD